MAHGHGPLPPLGCPPEANQILQELAGLEVVYVGEQAEQVQAAHRAGLLFQGDPFGLRCLPGPDSRYPLGQPVVLPNPWPSWWKRWSSCTISVPSRCSWPTAVPTGCP